MCKAASAPSTWTHSSLTGTITLAQQAWLESTAVRRLQGTFSEPHESDGGEFGRAAESISALVCQQRTNMMLSRQLTCATGSKKQGHMMPTITAINCLSPAECILRRAAEVLSFSKMHRRVKIMTISSRINDELTDFCRLKQNLRSPVIIS
jgi:hypothetical protein